MKTLTANWSHSWHFNVFTSTPVWFHNCQNITNSCYKLSVDSFADIKGYYKELYSGKVPPLLTYKHVLTVLYILTPCDLLLLLVRKLCSGISKFTHVFPFSQGSNKPQFWSNKWSLQRFVSNLVWTPKHNCSLKDIKGCWWSGFVNSKTMY